MSHNEPLRSHSEKGSFREGQSRKDCRERKGLVQVYTGDGKGKTTAAVGQAVRATGWGHKVCFIYFLKNLADYKTGEVEVMKKAGVQIFNLCPRSPRFYKDVDIKETRKECLEAAEFIKTKIFRDTNIDLLILDEMNIVLRDGYLKENEVLTLLRDKPGKMEIILTGRGAPEKIIEYADLVSRIEKIKHPLDNGVRKREGIEY